MQRNGDMPFLYNPTITIKANKRKETIRICIRDDSRGRGTLCSGMAISTGSETGVQTAAHLIVKNNYEQTRRKRARAEKKHAVRMQAGK